MDSQDVVSILEGVCCNGLEDFDSNPQLNILLQKILVRFYIHLWSLEADKKEQ